MDEQAETSLPVFLKEGRYQFETGGEMVGAVVQVGAEDLFEAFYYPLANYAHETTCSIGVAGPSGRPGSPTYQSAQENALQLFFKRRDEKRREAGYFPRVISRTQLPARGRIRLKGSPWLRSRSCGGQIKCACWYEPPPIQKERKTIIAVIDGEAKETEIEVDLRHEFRWREYFEQQCQICGLWTRDDGPAKTVLPRGSLIEPAFSSNPVVHFERHDPETGEVLDQHLYAHEACFRRCQNHEFCFCGRLGKVWRPTKIDARIIWRCHRHRDDWPPEIA